MPDRAMRLLWEHAFSVAGWLTGTANTRIDALAAAYNSEADAVVVGLMDEESHEIGMATLAGLADDEDLKHVPRYAVVVDQHDENLSGTRVFRQPCDPFWLIFEADSVLGREPPRGLGRRPFSESDTDIMVHAWWWGVAASDLVRQAIRLRDELGPGKDLVSRVAELVAARTDVRIDVMDARPPETDRGLPDGFAVTRGAGGQLWWRLDVRAEGISRTAWECISQVADALCGLTS